MRIWLTDPAKMCRQHLLGEHVEIHMFIGAMRKGYSMRGYLDANFLEPLRLKRRHDELVEEMFRRGYNHRSPLLTMDFLEPLAGLSDDDLFHTIDREAAKAELLRRCPECAAMHKEQADE